MFIITFCIAVVVFMPLLAKLPLAVVMHKQGGYDNKNPRTQQAKLDGFGARALAAHQNCYEAICMFTPTVLLVIAFEEHTKITVYLCIIFVLTRLFYLVAYWLDWDKVRSLFWVVGVITLFIHYYLLFF